MDQSFGALDAQTLDHLQFRLMDIFYKLRAELLEVVRVENARSLGEV